MGLAWCALALTPVVVLVWGVWKWCEGADDHIKTGRCECLRCRCEPGFRESMQAMNREGE